jgi:hypothetical protein
MLSCSVHPCIRLRRLFVLLAATCCILVITSPAFAQGPDCSNASYTSSLPHLGEIPTSGSVVEIRLRYEFGCTFFGPYVRNQFAVNLPSSAFQVSTTLVSGVSGGCGAVYETVTYITFLANNIETDLEWNYFVNYDGGGCGGAQSHGGFAVNLIWTQRSTACSYGLSVTEFSAPNSGTNSSVELTTGPTCKWTAISSQPSWLHVASALGIGSATVGFVVDANPGGVARDGMISLGGRGLQVRQGHSCRLSALTELTGDALRMEEWARMGNATAAPWSLYFPSIELELDTAAMALESDYGPGLTRTSGYRPYEYQKHFSELRDRFITAKNLTAAQRDACSTFIQELNNEIVSIHGIARSADGTPQVNPPDSSVHATVPALALDFNTLRLNPQQLSVIDVLAMENGLYRACPGKSAIGDKVHYSRKGVPCKQQIQAISHSPVALLVIDPSGRRVGYDSATRSVINEIGTDATFNGLDSEPQILEIVNPIDGVYKLTGTGIDTGIYEVLISRLSEDGDILESVNRTGTAVAGVQIELSVPVRKSIQIVVKPGDSSAPTPIAVDSVPGLIPIAILSSDSFNALTINIASLRAGRAGIEQSIIDCRSQQDINLDGRSDLLCRISSAATGIQPYDTQFILRATTTTGVPVEGFAPIRTTGNIRP